MTAGDDSTGAAPAPRRTPRALALGPTRQRASALFGTSFEELVLTGYDDLGPLAADPPTFVGVAAGPGLGDAMTAVLDQQPETTEIVVELPRDPHLAADLTRALDRPLRVSGVRRYADAPCLVLHRAASPDPAAADLVAAAITAAADEETATRAQRERDGVEWELAALRDRADLMENQLRTTRVQLARKRAEADELHGLVGRHDLVPTDPGRARQHEVATGRAGAGTTAPVPARSGPLARFTRGGSATDGTGTGNDALATVVDRLGALEELTAAALRRLETPPEHAPVTTADLDALGARLERVGALFAAAPPAGVVPPLGRAEATLCLLAVEDLLRRRPSTVLVAGDPLPALFVALAARRSSITTQVVVLCSTETETESARGLVARHGVDDLVEARHASLRRTPLSDHPTPWYDAEATSDLRDVGLVVAAGPSSATGPEARLPLVPLLADRFAGRCTVLVPDVDDDPAPDLAERWLTHLLAWAPTAEDDGVVALRSPS